MTTPASDRENPDPLLNEVQAAKLLDVSVARLQRWRWEGQGPAYIRVGGPHGRAVRYERAALSGWIVSNRVTPSAARA